METTTLEFLTPNSLNDSDPTYEAWKLRCRIALWRENCIYSDPTYEAWKQFIITSVILSNCIPILPMRHGNSFAYPPLPPFLAYSDPTYEAWKQFFASDSVN